jgi:hypothetical protein
LPSRRQLFGGWIRINGELWMWTDGNENVMDGVRGGQSGASALRCAAVHHNPTNQRHNGPGCVVPELKGEDKFSEPGVTSKVETVFCGTPVGNKPRSGLGQDALKKRRPGGRPLNKGIIQLSKAGTV